MVKVCLKADEENLSFHPFFVIKNKAVLNKTITGIFDSVWTQGRKLAGVSNGKSIQYQYAHTGNRVKKVVDGVTTEYRMAGSLLLSEKRADDTLQFHYDTNASLFSVLIDGSRYLYVKNIQSDIIGLLDVAGNLVVEYKYDSWGNTVSITGILADTVGVKNPFRYRGYYLDAETGLYYVGSRYYDPVIGRFISPDKYEVLSVSQRLLTDKNLYVYCDNNPVMRKDIGGAFWETALDVISLGASIVEVAINPTDLWAWAGLVGDVIDMAPFVTGLGEAVDVYRTSVKVGDDVVAAAKKVKLPDSVKKSTGSYEIHFSSGYQYAGKGGFDRAIESAKIRNGNDPVLSIKWKSAPYKKAAFIDEYYMQLRYGGVLSYDKKLKTYNQRWSPGKRYATIR